MRASLVPPPPIRRLRDLTRARTDLNRDRTRQIHRLEKILQDAGIKLSSVATDIMGQSSRAMLDALIEGKADPAAMADLAKRRMRSKIPALTEALTGRFTPVIGGELTAAERLAEITGLGQVSAQVIIAEIGLDMMRFPTAGHLVSWANLCPRTIQSGPVQRGGKTGKGNPYLKGVLGEAAAVAAGRTLSSESAIGASSSAGASSKRSSLSPARSWSSSGICWPIRPRASMISAAITTLAASTSTADFATTSPNLRRSATASLSNQPPDRTDPTQRLTEVVLCNRRSST